MTTPLKILFKITSRNRPDKFYATLQSIFDNCVSKEYEILVSLDSDDPTLEQYKRMFFSPVVMEWKYGTSKNKISAINRDMDLGLNFDVLINCSDDQLFIKKGFDDVIRDAFIDKSLMRPDLDLFVHFPDGNQKKLATMSIMGRTYYERDKYIYHPDYKSLFCDNEAQEVAIKRACYKFVDDDIFVHNHPAWGKAQTDAQYQHTESFWNEDELTYNRRKAIDFGI